MVKQIRWKFLLFVFKVKRFFRSWFGRRRLDYAKKKLFIGTSTIREYETRARSVKKEPATVSWLEKNTGEGAVLYDVGANIGAYSLIAGSLGAKVFAFEPAHQNIAALRENIDMNGLGASVSIIPLMVGEGAGIRRFDVADGTSGSSAGFFSGSAHTGGEHPASFLSLTLDSARTVFSLPEPTAMKIDVDGGEVEVLSSAKQTLSLRSLRSVLVETADEHADVVKRLMNEAGFAVSSEARMDARTVNYVFDRV